MYDTTIMLKPREQWRPGITYEKLIQEMDAKLQFPGLSNTWTMPVENRLDMELTGIKTPLGLKIQGPTLEGIQQAGAQIQQLLSSLPEVRSIFSERVSQGFYINVEVNRLEAARYGLTVADVQQAVSSGIGGEMVTENIEGRERYPVNVRYSRDFRDNVDELRRVLIATPSGAQIPIEQVAHISFSRGPAMIRDEDGALTGYVYIDLNSKDYGGFVKAANDLFRQKLHLQPGHTYKWAGEYEFEQRAKERLKIILPVVFFVIFVLLYMVFPLGRGIRSAHLSDDLRAYGWTHPAEAARLQLQRRGRGCGLHRAVRHRRRDGCGDGRLSARGIEPATRIRETAEARGHRRSSH
jgi:Cu(I)/Ag(I) efflux system membrane protein CusA/SilA